MTVETEILHSLIGRRIAELRKGKGLSQSDLASRLSRRRTQAWVSTVEAGRRNVNISDLFEFAAIFDTTISELADMPFRSSSASPISVGGLMHELDSRLPIEMPLYLQSDLGEPDAEPIDYQYSSNVPGKSVFNRADPVAQVGNLSAMVVERYYSSPNLDPTDLLTYNRILIPQSDPDVRVADRILVRLKKPHAGLSVHPCLIRSSGEAETTLSGQQTTVFAEDSFEILGVLVLRRTLYRSSVIRTWIQRQYGIVKDERLVN